MPVETRETEPGCRFDQPAHPDKGGTETFASSQTVYPSRANALGIAVVRVAVSPRPQTKEFADDGVLLEPAERRQPDHGGVVC